MNSITKKAFLVWSFFFIGKLFSQPLIIDSNLDSVEYNTYLHYSLQNNKENPQTNPNRLDFSQQTWEKVTNSTANFGYSEDVFWFRLPLFVKEAPKEGDLSFVVDYPLIDEMDIYLTDSENRVLDSVQSGDMRPFANRSRNFRLINFSLKIPKSSQSENYIIYFRVASTSPIQVAGKILSPQAFEESLLQDTMGNGIYFGGIIIVGIYNLFVYFFVRQSKYLYYVTYVFVFAMFQAVLNGYGAQIFFPNDPIIAHYSVILLIFGAAITSLIFGYKYFNLTPESRFGKVILFSNAVGIIMASTVFFISIRMGIQLSVFFAIIFMIPVLLTLGIFFFIKKSPDAIYYLASWVALLFGALSTALSSLGLIPATFIVLYGTQIGSLLECVLQSVGLAQQMETMRKTAENLTHNLEKEVMIRTDQYKEEKLKAEEALLNLRNTQEALSRSERSASIGSMVSHLAHEVNNPLNFIATGEIISRESLAEAKSFILKAIPDSPESTPFKEKIQSMFSDVETGFQQSSKGTLRIKDTIQEIRAITGVDGIHVNSFDLIPEIYSNWDLTSEKNQVNPASIQLEVNQVVWPEKFSESKIILSQKYILARAIRTLLNNSLYFCKNNPQPKIQIELNSLSIQNENLTNFLIRNNGPAISVGKEVDLFDLKKSKYFGTELIGLPFVKELLKSVQCNLTLTDNGRHSGWVEFQILMKDYQ